MKIMNYDDPYSCLDVELGLKKQTHTYIYIYTHKTRANREHQNSIQLSALIQ